MDSSLNSRLEPSPEPHPPPRVSLIDAAEGVPGRQADGRNVRRGGSGENAQEQGDEGEAHDAHQGQQRRGWGHGHLPNGSIIKRI
jgi:hypothetical protein